MKKLFWVLCSLGLAFCSAGSYAGSGKAFVPTWVVTGGQTSTYISISNITDNPIELNLTFYGKEGALIYPSEITGIDNMTLAPKSTGYVRIYFDQYDQGFGIIEWKNIIGSGDDAVAILSHAERITITGRYSIPINKGMPF
ncbi:hypothetical protein [Marinomonas sp. PE14-40]|uniref:hypothetical protein n=1 Tax=Marinomonas sp. PE14-40 TaxID=3060621 RepID=UPI003F6624D3